MKRCWLLLLPFVAAACSDDTTGPEHAPVISNLRFSPSSVYVTDFTGAGITVEGQFDFTDEDGDLQTLRMTTTAGMDLTLPLDGVGGLRSGTLIGQFLVPPSPTGSYGVSVWVVDAKAHASNILEGTFEVRVDDSGTGWTTRPSGTTVQLNALAALDEGYITVGYGGVILHSVDGLTWTPCASGTTSALWAVVWSGALAVAVGENSAICTSSDGVAWTPQFAPALPDPLYDVAWSGTTFVAVGFTAGAEPTQIVTSPDGVTWTPRPALGGVRELRALVWTGSYFVAAGTTNDDATVIAVSADGESWSIDAQLEPVFPRDICWTETRTVIVGGNGKVLVATTGANWIGTESGANFLGGVASSGGRFLAVGTGVWTSTDGSVWEQANQEPGLIDVVWAGERYLAVGFGGAIATSP